MRVQYRPGFMWCMTSLAERDLVHDEEESAVHCCGKKGKSDPRLHLWGLEGTEIESSHSQNLSATPGMLNAAVIPTI